MGDVSETDERIVGRDEELAKLRDFIGGAGRPPAMVISGPAGIGKTTLWDAGIEQARAEGFRVLVARGSDAETQHSFAALIDLFDDVEIRELGELPAPQRRALDVAMLRADPQGSPTDPHATALGALSALRFLAANEPVLIAIDDVQWIDRASGDVLDFATRRLGREPIRFLLGRRSRLSSPLVQALGSKRFEQLEVGPLSLGAIRRILFEQLGLTLPRRVVRLIFDSSLGNPYFTLEIGRMLAEGSPPEIGQSVPVPALIRGLPGARFEQLDGSQRKLLLAVSLNCDLNLSQLGELTDSGAVEDAIDVGVLVVDRGRVRAEHPLLAAAAKERSRARERRELHLQLAGVATDAETRALHLALAAQRPDPELAAMLGAAAADARARGASEQAVELGEHALRLTPAGSPEATDRLLALAEYLFVAGETDRITDLIAPAVDQLPYGFARGNALLLLADGREVTSVEGLEAFLDRALAESDGDAFVRATALARKAELFAVGRVGRIAEAEAMALEAVEVAAGADSDAQLLSLHALAWARALGGGPVDDLNERFRAATGPTYHLADSIDRVAALRLGWRGEAIQAREELSRLRALADDRGEALSFLTMQLHLCELGLRAGNWSAAVAILDEGELSGKGNAIPAAVQERCRALLGVARGLPEEAERWVSEALAGTDASGIGWDRLEARRAQGIAALLTNDSPAAAESLRAVWSHTEREGVADPGVFPVAPDLVEALVELGELDEAREVTARLGELAAEQVHPWGLLSAERCAALLRLTRSNDDEAVAALDEAAAGYEALGLSFDHARTLLILGRAQRRLKQWGTARRALEAAAAAFEEIGSPGWADQARAELGRVSARPPRASGELTPAELRTAELAAEGLANKEIAQRLFVTVHTVEAHLSRAYAKLDIRSRAQLAGRLSEKA